MKRSHNIALLAAIAAIAIGGTLASVHHRKEVAAAKALRKSARIARVAKFKRPATSVVPRSGLPDFARKLDAREPLKIAFIGGSITQNAAAGGYVTEVAAWLERHAPGIRAEIVNAGVAGTGSDFGAQRVDRDVIVHRPDLVFVEFAVNDAARECVADMERIVRKIREAGAPTDIVFLYTVTNESLPMLAIGKFPIAVVRHEKVAEHYGIPTVALGYEATRKMHSGEWTWSDFSADTCHPTAAGYASYNRDIDAALDTLIAVRGAASAQMPPPLTPGLVLHPAPAQAAPQPAPKPLTDETGAVAIQTDELPDIGVHWVGEPRFPQSGDAVWRLAYRSLAHDAAFDATVGLDRTDWQPQRWFDELRCFTGGTSHTLAKCDDGSGNRFGSSPRDGAILLWRAPSDDSYLLRVVASGLDGARGMQDAAAALNVVRLDAGATRGESIAFQLTPTDAAAAFELQRRIDLPADAEIAFVFAARGFKFAHYTGFRVTIGRFAAKPRE